MPREPRPEIFQEIEDHSRFGHIVYTEFHLCPLMKAIDKHICDEDNACLLFEREAELYCHRGTGAVNFREASVSYSIEDQDFFWITIKVSYYNEDECYPYDNYDRRYIFKVPKDLHINFTEDKFKKWLLDTYSEREKRKEEEIEKHLVEWRKHYPDAFTMVRRQLRKLSQKKD